MPASAAALRAAADLLLDARQPVDRGLAEDLVTIDEEELPDLIALARSFPAAAVCEMTARLPPAALAGMQRVAVAPCRQFGTESESVLAYYRALRRPSRLLRTPAGQTAARTGRLRLCPAAARCRRASGSPR